MMNTVHRKKRHLNLFSLLLRGFDREVAWAAPSEVYPIMTRVLVAQPYRFPLLTGLITSAGGMTESLVRHSSTCLIQYLDGLSTTTDPSLDDMARVFVAIFEAYTKQDRVVLPLMDVIGLLYESGTFANVSDVTL